MTEIDYENLLLQRGSELALDLFTLEGTFKAATAAVTDSYATFNSRVKQAYEQAQTIRINVQKQFGILDEESGRMLAKKISDQQNFLKQNEITVAKFASNFNKVGSDLNTYVIKRSDEAVISFAKLVSINEKFGITTQNTMDLVNKLGGGFGMNAEQIDKFSGKLLTFAKETGQDFNKVFSDFNKSMQSFYTILDPEKAGTQFMSFQQMARGFGTTIESLMQTAAKFDDIQQGVDFGAGLNNVLSAVGGSFDAVLASTMDYDSRIKYIMKSIADTRGNIDQMSEVSQRAFIRQLQQSSGLSDQVLTSLLRNEQLTSNIENMTTGQGEFRNLEQISNDKMQKMATDFTTLQERSQLFLNVWTQFGSRIEQVYDVQSRFLSDTQFKILSPLSTAIEKATNLADVTKIFQNSVSDAINMIKDYIFGPAPGDVDRLRLIVGALHTQYDKALKAGFAKPSKPVLPPPPKVPSVEAGGMEGSNNMYLRGAEAIMAAAEEMKKMRENPPQLPDIKITVTGGQELLSVFKFLVEYERKNAPGTVPAAAP